MRRAWSATGARDARVQIVLPAAPAARPSTSSAIFQFGTAGNLGRRHAGGVRHADRAEVMNRVGEFDEIRVVAEPGVSQTALSAAIAYAVRALPPTAAATRC